MKDAPRIRHFAEDDLLEHGVCEELRRYSKEFHATGIQRLKQRWKEFVHNEEDFVGK
jgi:hypothetical protein